MIGMCQIDLNGGEIFLDSIFVDSEEATIRAAFRIPARTHRLSQMRPIYFILWQAPMASSAERKDGRERVCPYRSLKPRSGEPL